MRSVLHLLRSNRQFLTGALLLGAVAVFALLSFFSPYPPNDSFVVPPDVPPSWAYPMGTTSRGQDLFWLLTFSIRNTLLFGLTVALISRLLALVIGLVAGYCGGLVDRALMSINDTFIVIPLFPILVLFYFVMMKDSKRFADSGGWGWAAFDYDVASGTFRPANGASKPPQGNDAKCGLACHTDVVTRDYVFTEYGKR